MAIKLTKEMIMAVYKACAEKHPHGCWGQWQAVSDDPSLAECVGCGYRMSKDQQTGRLAHLADKKKAVEYQITFRQGN